MYFTYTIQAPFHSCLVAYWDFDEGTGSTAHDSENGYDGVINGATWTTGVSGNALSFDGTDDYVEVNCETGTSFNFPGLIDEVKVYGCVLTADKIQAEYDAGSPP